MGESECARAKEVTALRLGIVKSLRRAWPMMAQKKSSRSCLRELY